MTASHATPSLVKRLWRDYMRHYKVMLVIAIIGMLVTAFAANAQAWLIKPAIDDVLIGHDASLLLLVPALIIGVSVLRGVASYIQTVALNKIAMGTISDMQNHMFRSLIHADMAFLMRDSSGVNLSRFLSDTHFVRDMLSKAITGMARDLVMVVGFIGYMFYENAQFATVIIVTFPLAIWPILVIGRKIRKLSRQTQEELGRMTSQLDDNFKGIRQVRAYCRESDAMARSHDFFDRIRHLSIKAVETRARTYPLLESLAGFAVGTIIAYGGYQVMHGLATPGQLMSFLTVLIMAFQPIRGLANLNASLQTGLAATVRIFDIIDDRPRITSPVNAKKFAIKQGKIHIKNIDFQYPGGTSLFENFSLEIAAAKKTAIIGPSGSGKSTLFDLLLRFYDPQAGEILIDGQAIDGLNLHSLRQNIGIVSQQTILFNDTIANNIAYGGDNVDQNQIISAAKAANAHEFIDAMPEGYASWVGEGGDRLSGGQRQRIAIARAIIKNAPILLLDEATSALDNAGEKLVQKALDNLMAGRTSIIIAHKLSTIETADHIVMMEHGRIQAQGSHETLMQSCERYRLIRALDGGHASLY